MTEPSPQRIKSIAATRKFWNEIETEFGLLTLSEFSRRINVATPDRVAQLQATRAILAVTRPDGFHFPGFQLDSTDRVRPVIADLLQAAADFKHTDNYLAMWLCMRTGYLNGDRPVDHLDEPARVVAAVRNAWDVQW